jgi:hypothetical protein
MSDTSSEKRLVVRRNTDATWEVQGLTVDADGVETPATGFDPADAIEVKVTNGEDQAALLTLTGEWSDAEECLFTIAVTASQTSALSPGVWPIDATILPAGGGRIAVLDAWFEITEAPGVSTAPPVYGSLQDLFDFGGGEWLNQLRFNAGMANFTRQRARARTKLDDLILGAYRPWTRYNGAPAAFLAASALGGGEGLDPTMKAYLAANKLIVTERTREICACYALEIICRGQFTFADDDPFPQRANYFKALAGRAVKGYRVEIDTNDDDLPDFAFNLGVHSFR